MSEQTAPTKQLLVTEDNITELVNKLYVKKSDIKNPFIVENLKHLCSIVTNDPIEIALHPHAPFRNPQRMLAIFQLRKEILETASEIYAEAGEEKLFDEATDELGTIIQILEKHTVIK